MKVPINQTNVSRVGINTARIQGIRLGSASKRGGETSPFHPSLVDYWSFKGKSNFDKDRNTIKGIKGEILTAYNFGWSLGSGYGLFKENFNDYVSFDGERGNFTLTDNSIHITEILKPFLKFITQQTIASNSYKVKVSGLTDDIDLVFNGAISLDPIKEVTIKLVNGINDIPVTVAWGGFQTVKFTGKCDITIQQIPEYEGAIVTDGIDDYLKLDKIGYKIGTVILKYKTLSYKYEYVFSVNDELSYIEYTTAENAQNDVLNYTFNRVFKNGEYYIAKYVIPKSANDSLYIATSILKKDFMSMALYEIAIYEDVLTDEEIQKEIKVMEYGTPNPVFALNFDNFAYKAVDYPDFATGKATTNKIVVDSTTESFTGVIAVAMNPEVTTGDAIEVPAYKLKISGFNDYNLPESSFGVAILASNISGGSEYIAETPALDGVYDVPSIALSDGIFNLAIVTQIAIDKPIEIEILYDKNVTKSFPETKQIFP